MQQDDRLGPQLPLALRYPPDQRFETWLGAPATLAQLRALASGEAGDALYLQGGSGSGKTHLLLAACAAAEAGGASANYLSLARVRGRARAALQGIEQAGLVALDDLDAAAINTNFALPAGLTPGKDSIAQENAKGPYVNVIVVQEQNKDKPWVAKLIKAYQSEENRKFIQTEFKGSVVAGF